MGVCRVQYHTDGADDGTGADDDVAGRDGDARE